MPQASFKTSIYNLIRKKTCPFSAVEKYVPKEGKIYDLGCGFASFSAFMYSCSNSREIIGVDWIKSRINYAENMFPDRIKFIYTDIADFIIDTCSAILLIDVLYLLPYAKQKEILIKCYNALENKGVLLVKEMDSRPLLKYCWCLSQELIVTKILKRNLSTGMYFRKKDDFFRLLQDIGFNVEAVKLDRGYLYPHILYVCKK
ncbi:methyltransferase domain-containing protein [bacterium]|nr:MAG: methyltransferase domain-containing protein [bacterium]